MKFFQPIAFALGFAGLAHAHMEMDFPPPFKSSKNPNSGSDIDYSMTSPLSADGSNFPCKGYHTLFGTPEGKPTAEFAAGSQYEMTISGGANHEGGSCQASLSFDKGTTWRVIHSYIGNCPVAGTSKLPFTVPADTPSGEAIFAWTWFNKVGNREMYMNCAAVTITGGSKKRDDALSDHPTIYVANVGNSCTTLEGKDVQFPNPGKDVTTDSTDTYVPNCGGGSPGGANAPVATAPPATFSTLITVIKSSTPDTTAPADPPTTVAAQPTPTSGSGNDGSNGSGDSFAAGTACSNEGEWNCVGSSKFQRCASGQWSVLMDVAPGTKCNLGKASTFSISSINQRRRFFRRA
ncbi:hypothetical protein BGZ63DRAFT_355097 [Mariannaea sp. PMI_226]|nr:hypothetical protein BGZ63DRAFT_355097 [Mariannaea sp. PMI_226]